MPKILIPAYQCPWTEKIFDDKNRYVEYLKKRRYYNYKKRKSVEYQKKIKQFNQVHSWQEFIDWFNNNGQAMWFNTTGASHNFLLKDCDDVCAEIVQLNATYSKHVSNTHSCPRDGVTNFSRDPDKPTGYPGWHGQIQWCMKRNKKTEGWGGWGSDLVRGTNIHTGTGGGIGKNHYSYEFRMYDSDWPNLTQEVVEHILRTGNDRVYFKYSNKAS